MHLRQLVPSLPSIEDLPAATSRETALLCQWAALGEALDRAPEPPRLRRDLLVISTEGEVGEEADKIDAFLERAMDEPSPVRLVEADASIEFWLDLPHTPAWRSFGYSQGQVCFLLDDLALLPERGALH